MFKESNENLKELADLAGNLAEQGFIGVDASSDIALGDYGFLWDPRTFKAVFYNCKISDPRFKVFTISLKDVRDELDHIDPGFFNFADLPKDLNIQNYHVPSLIQSINHYNGTLADPFHVFDLTIKDVREKLLPGAIS